jgi:hypothetical protein
MLDRSWDAMFIALNVPSSSIPTRFLPYQPFHSHPPREWYSSIPLDRLKHLPRPLDLGRHQEPSTTSFNKMGRRRRPCIYRPCVEPIVKLLRSLLRGKPTGAERGRNQCSGSIVSEWMRRHGSTSDSDISIVVVEQSLLR